MPNNNLNKIHYEDQMIMSDIKNCKYQIYLARVLSKIRVDRKHSIASMLFVQLG